MAMYHRILGIKMGSKDGVIEKEQNNISSARDACARSMKDKASDWLSSGRH